MTTTSEPTTTQPPETTVDFTTTVANRESSPVPQRQTTTPSSDVAGGGGGLDLFQVGIGAGITSVLSLGGLGVYRLLSNGGPSPEEVVEPEDGEGGSDLAEEYLQDRDIEDDTDEV
jgi:hypothetical protein